MLLSLVKTKEKISYQNLKPWVLSSFTSEQHKGNACNFVLIVTVCLNLNRQVINYVL